jgi:hypothetical protein
MVMGITPLPGRPETSFLSGPDELIEPLSQTRVIGITAGKVDSGQNFAPSPG